MAIIAPDLGINLGTCNTQIYVKKKGIVIDEPTIVVVDHSHRKASRAFGDEARSQLGRTSGEAEAVRPVRDAHITDFSNASFLLQYFVRKAIGASHVVKPRAILTLPCQLTAADRHALHQAAAFAGLREKQLFLISKPFAAALGAQMPVFDPVGSMIVDVGGGTTDVAVISLGGIVASKSIKIGGERMNEAIVSYVKREFSVDITPQIAEDIKFTLGAAVPLQRERRVEVRGRDMISNLPQDIIISSTKIFEALQTPCQAILGAIQDVLERTPPELCGDILRGGIMLTGGGAQLFGLDQLISSELNLPVAIAHEPLASAIMGVGHLAEQLDDLARIGKTGFLDGEGE